VIRPTLGRVWFENQDITGRSVNTIVKIGIGRSFQITSIFPGLTARQNIQYSILAREGRTRRVLGRVDRASYVEAMRLLEEIGLDEHAEVLAVELSHGDQRAVELGISIALGSKLILLDEPTAGMSPYETQRAMTLVRRLTADKGLTLLFCEHDMEVVFGTADVVTVMDQGRVLTEGTPDEVRSNTEVQRVYLGEPERTHSEETL
jgi:branched-chain amino acid transport system ATP-binding protein